MPAKRSDPQTMHRAGELRREMTPAEKKLWAYLRERQFHGIKFIPSAVTNCAFLGSGMRNL